MKARDVRPGDTVMCCRERTWDHLPHPVEVQRIIRARGTKRIAFGYIDRSGAARDTNGITQSYLPDETVVTP